MRKIPLLLALLSPTLGCVDGLGISSNCSVQMQSVRVSQGGPPDATEQDDDRGDYVEEWYFDEGRRKYTFRWGVSYDGCEVQSGNFTRSPTPGS